MHPLSHARMRSPSRSSCLHAIARPMPARTPRPSRRPTLRGTASSAARWSRFKSRQQARQSSDGRASDFIWAAPEDGIRCMAQALLSNSLQKEGTYPGSLPMIEALLAHGPPRVAGQALMKSSKLSQNLRQCIHGGRQGRGGRYWHKDLCEQMCTLHGPDVQAAAVGVLLQTPIKVEQ